MDPLAIAAGLNQSGPPEVCKVARYFWLVRAYYGHQETDTDLVARHQAEQTETGTVSQCLKEQLHIEFLWAFTHSLIFFPQPSNMP